jgi:hypothetical protein
MWWAVHVARLGLIRNAWKLSGEKPDRMQMYIGEYIKNIFQMYNVMEILLIDRYLSITVENASVTNNKH